MDEAREQRKKWSYANPLPLLLLWFIGQRNYFLFSRALLITACKKIAQKIKDSVFTVDLPFIKVSKWFPRSCNAPSTKSAHSVTDISWKQYIKDRDPQTLPQPLWAVSLVPWGSVSFNSLNEPNISSSTVSLRNSIRSAEVLSICTQKVWFTKILAHHYRSSC